MSETNPYIQNFPESVAGSGLSRICGKRGPVTADIPKDGAGKVRLDRREWDATAFDNIPLKAGTRVEVTRVRPDGSLEVKRANPGG